jgi:hypothetical protein
VWMRGATFSTPERLIPGKGRSDVEVVHTSMWTTVDIAASSEDNSTPVCAPHVGAVRPSTPGCREPHRFPTDDAHAAAPTDQRRRRLSTVSTPPMTMTNLPRRR